MDQKLTKCVMLGPVLDSIQAITSDRSIPNGQVSSCLNNFLAANDISAAKLTKEGNSHSQRFQTAAKNVSVMSMSMKFSVNFGRQTEKDQTILLKYYLFILTKQPKPDLHNLLNPQNYPTSTCWKH